LLFIKITFYLPNTTTGIVLIIFHGMIHIID